MLNHLHVDSPFSFLDGASNSKDLVWREQKLGIQIGEHESAAESNLYSDWHT
jgi:hypothetical protein